MRYVVTAEQMRRYDTNTIEHIGIPGMVLMERAALAARDRVVELYRQMISANTGSYSGRGKVLVMAGMGNNGGDGLALARLLYQQKIPVEVWCVGNIDKVSGQWLAQREILKSYEVQISDVPTREEYTILVDALFGVGLSRDVKGEFEEAVRRFGLLDGYKIALDMPSGICSDTGRVLGCAVRVDETLTFAFAKRGLYLYPGCEYAGAVSVADIGIDETAFMGENPEMFYLDCAAQTGKSRNDLFNMLPARKNAGNKGTFGKVLLIAGGHGMAGAAILCAKAAYRAGAGMVKVLTDESNRVILQESVPEALYGTWNNLKESLGWADVVVIGPGIGKSQEALACLEMVICHEAKPLLIDADGLNLLAEQNNLIEVLSAQEERPVILTPHVGELSRLSGVVVSRLKENLWQYAGDLAEKLHCVVVAKDARSFVCAQGQPACMNICGNNGMATAGSGDVLAGIIAGLWGQYSECDGERAFCAACAGMYLHGIAGDLVANQKGKYALMAGDLADAVAEIMRTCTL